MLNSIMQKTDLNLPYVRDIVFHDTVGGLYKIMYYEVSTSNEKIIILRNILKRSGAGSLTSQLGAGLVTNQQTSKVPK